MAKKIVNTNGVEDAELIEAPVVTVLPPEIEERVDKEISLAIVEVNYTDDFIRKMKEEFLPMTINGQQDKEGYLNLQAVRKQVKQARILVEKTFKRGREIAQLEVKKWITKQNEIVGEIKAVEKALEEKEDAWEQERDRLKEIERQRIEQQGVARVTDMVRFGAKLEGVNWVLNEVQYEAQLVKESDPEIYQTIYNDFEAQFKLNEAEKRAAKEKADREALELKQAQENIQRREKELQDQQEKMAKQMEELNRHKLIAQKSVYDERISQLQKLGLIGLLDPGYYERFGFQILEENTTLVDIVISLDLEQEEWDKFMAIAIPHAEKVKEAKRMEQEARDRKAEEKRQQDLKDAADTAKGNERIKSVTALNRRLAYTTPLEIGQLSDEDWDKVFKPIKEAYDEDLRKMQQAQEEELKEQERLRKERELAEAGDKAKYADTLKYILATPLHEMRSSQYRTKMKIIRDFIDGLK
jgi:hypothetical protein